MQTKKYWIKTYTNTHTHLIFILTFVHRHLLGINVCFIE